MTETVNTALQQLISEVQALSYVDDTVLIGPADALSNALAQLPTLLRASGLELQPPKTQVWAHRMQNLMRVPALRKLRSQMKDPRGPHPSRRSVGQQSLGPVPSGRRSLHPGPPQRCYRGYSG